MRQLTRPLLDNSDSLRREPRHGRHFMQTLQRLQSQPSSSTSERVRPPQQPNLHTHRYPPVPKQVGLTPGMRASGEKYLSFAIVSARYAASVKQTACMNSSNVVGKARRSMAILSG